MITKYDIFWNFYLALLFIVFLLVSLFDHSKIGVNYFSFIYATFGIMMLSDTLLNNIKKGYIITFFILFLIITNGFIVVLAFFSGLIVVAIPLVIVPLTPIVLLQYKSKVSLSKIPRIISSTLCLILSLLSFLFTYRESGPLDFIRGSAILSYVFAVDLMLLIFISLMFFERDKLFKYIIMLFIINSIFFLESFGNRSVLITTEYLIKNKHILYYGASTCIILYMLTLLDIVFGKFFTKLNDYIIKLAGITAIGYSIFILVYTFISKWPH